MLRKVKNVQIHGIKFVSMSANGAAIYNVAITYPSGGFDIIKLSDADIQLKSFKLNFDNATILISTRRGNDYIVSIEATEFNAA